MVIQEMVVLSQVGAPPLDQGSSGILAWVCGILCIAVATLWYMLVKQNKSHVRALTAKDAEISRLTDMMVEKNDKLQETLTRLIEKQ